jgi:hypothetical protein
MNYNFQRHFRTSLVVMGERQSGIGQHYNNGGFDKMDAYAHGGQ